MLQCVFIPTLTLLQSSEQPPCPDMDYRSEKGICCNRCFPGNVWSNSQHTHLITQTVKPVLVKLSSMVTPPPPLFSRL